MIREYTTFFVTGVILASVAWALQFFIYGTFGSETAYSYALASAITLVPLVCINFAIQALFVFKRSGFFLKFIATDISIIILVSVLSPLCRELIGSQAGMYWGDRGGFITAALISSVPSFFIRKYWVFIKPSEEVK